MVNSNGVAVDPKGKLWPYGGEALSAPTDSADGQAEQLALFLGTHPDAAVNYRSNLHVHVRVPGLATDLAALKRFQEYNATNAGVLDLVEPIPVPQRLEYASKEEFEGAQRRYRRRLVSHHTVVTRERVERQLRATSVQEFFAAECPRNKQDGSPLWHLAPRAAVNLRHLRESVETVEFRHFPGTLAPGEVSTCVRWCQRYTEEALFGGMSAAALFHEEFADARFPKFSAYEHWKECRYRATCHDGSLTKEQIMANIDDILRLDRMDRA